MSFADALREAASAIEKAALGLAAISHLTKTTTDDRAADMLRAVAAGLDDIIADLGVHIDPHAVLDHLQKLKDEITKTDAAIDAEIERKLDGKP